MHYGRQIALVLVASLGGCNLKQAMDEASPLYQEQQRIQAERDAWNESQTAEYASRTKGLPVTAEWQAKTEAYMKTQLKDPDSAKFEFAQATSAHDNEIAICGAVNARNGYGGYTGFQRFFVHFVGESPVASDIVPLSYHSLMINYCGGG